MEGERGVEGGPEQCAPGCGAERPRRDTAPPPFFSSLQALLKDVPFLKLEEMYANPVATDPKVRGREGERWTGYAAVSTPTASTCLRWPRARALLARVTSA